MTKADSRPGLSMAQVLTLPKQQRQVLQWMMKRSLYQSVTLAQMVAQMDVDQETAIAVVDELVGQGFIQEIFVDGELSYRIQLAIKQGIQQEQIQQSLTPGSPLALIFNPSGDFAVKANSQFEISVTITNTGGESALIDVFLDELSSQLTQWCTVPRQRLALNPKSISEVVFEFQVPLAIIPQTYNYCIVIDAPQHYPEDTPIRHGAKIQVLPAIESVIHVSDPTFTLLPQTNPRSPVQIPPSGTLQVNVQVHNRSDRVDRFRLSCLDLDPAWFTIRYPEGLETAGLISLNMGLDLNPGEKGEIILSFNPPLIAIAGIYYPTIRLYSANNSDLNLLDIIYWEILPSYLLNVELLTIVGRVRQKNGVFELKLTNLGNTLREVTSLAIASDEDQLCTYTITPPTLQVLPGGKASAQLQVKPSKWWRRPIFGAGKLINFRIQLEDQQQFPLPNGTFPGTLIWEARPFWQFGLLLLTGLGFISTIIFIIWLLLRPSASPKITQFAAQDPVYEAANGDFIRLKWQIHHPEQLQSLLINGLSADGTPLTQPISYFFGGKLPQQLQSFCSIGIVLTCTNVPTYARSTGDYIFEIKAFSRNNSEVAADILKTNTIKILPIPPAKIGEFFATKPVYQEVPRDFKNPISNPKQPQIQTQLIRPDTIRLNWKIDHPDQIKELRLIGRSPEGIVNSKLQRYDLSHSIPKSLQDFCQIQLDQMICQNVPTKNYGAGDYIFELQLFSKADTDKPSVVQKTDVIKVKPIPSQILEFKINGINPLAKYQVTINPAHPIQAINLSWRVKGSSNIQVELLPTPGNVARTGNIPYPISPKPNSETITLQVTSPSGDKVSRSVTLETLLLPTTQKNTSPKLPQLKGVNPQTGVPVIPTANGTGKTPANEPTTSPSPTPGLSAPSAPGKLSPLEIPPRF